MPLETLHLSDYEGRQMTDSAGTMDMDFIVSVEILSTDASETLVKLFAASDARAAFLADPLDNFCMLQQLIAPMPGRGAHPFAHPSTWDQLDVPLLESKDLLGVPSSHVQPGRPAVVRLWKSTTDDTDELLLHAVGLPSSTSVLHSRVLDPQSPMDFSPANRRHLTLGAPGIDTWDAARPGLGHFVLLPGADAHPVLFFTSEIPQSNWILDIPKLSSRVPALVVIGVMVATFVVAAYWTHQIVRVGDVPLTQQVHSYCVVSVAEGTEADDAPSEDEMFYEGEYCEGNEPNLLQSLKRFGTKVRQTFSHRTLYSDTTACAGSSRSSCWSLLEDLHPVDMLSEFSQPRDEDSHVTAEEARGLLSHDGSDNGEEACDVVQQPIVFRNLSVGRLSATRLAPFNSQLSSEPQEVQRRNSPCTHQDDPGLDAFIKLRPAANDSVGDIDDDEGTPAGPLVGTGRKNMLNR